MLLDPPELPPESGCGAGAGAGVGGGGGGGGNVKCHTSII
jgi:hypothetical protein